MENIGFYLTTDSYLDWFLANWVRMLDRSSLTNTADLTLADYWEEKEVVSGSSGLMVVFTYVSVMGFAKIIRIFISSSIYLSHLKKLDWFLSSKNKKKDFDHKIDIMP